MHCCCKNSVQACIILVIIGGILSILAIVVNKTAERDQPIDRTENLCIGIIYTLICGVLIFGATMRNIKVIAVWMVLACIHLLYEVHYFCSFVRKESVMEFLRTFVIGRLQLILPLELFFTSARGSWQVGKSIATL